MLVGWPCLSDADWCLQSAVPLDPRPFLYKAGGITQHLGAFIVQTSKKNNITFLDTPGHAAFSAMRERGANATDIVVLVVAADDGVMPQTIESIKFARAANVPIVVAINKIDKNNADVEKAKLDLLANHIDLEEIGGETQCVPISALKNLHLDTLEEAIITAAELADLRGDTTGLAEGVVLESRVVKGQGPIATVLVQRGTLKTGAYLVAGETICRVKTMKIPGSTTAIKYVTFRPVSQFWQVRANFARSCPQRARGLLPNTLKTERLLIADLPICRTFPTTRQALPSEPVEISGWKDVPAVGDIVLNVESEKRAREVLSYREDAAKNVGINTTEGATQPTETVGGHPAERAAAAAAAAALAAEGQVVEEERIIRLILKTDVAGSEEAVEEAIMALVTEAVHVEILATGVGEVTDRDVEQAQLGGATILCFNVPIPGKMMDSMDRGGVSVESFSIIYKLLDYLTERIDDLSPAQLVEIKLGHAEVLQTFTLTGARKALVAGCAVKSGNIVKGAKCRVFRGDEMLYDGQLETLMHHRDDAEQIKAGQECGLGFELFSDFAEGDVIECYKIEEV